MTPKQLNTLNKDVRKMISDHLTRTGQTLNNFARECGIHQNQLWMYLYSGDEKKGLHTFTIEKIGRYLAKK